ncbi:MAG TPA: hypothetical protein DDY98_05325 [Ruminococcaceae bacterium]|nr:hypothetical protein [Oscillospiraceae bacterium]
MSRNIQHYTPGPKVHAAPQKKASRKPIIISFFVVLFLGAAVALYLPLRPQYSESEKRELTKFPKFSFSALADGSYFNGISTWYADTFPWREMLLNADSKIKSFYGIGDTVSELPNLPADEIPDVKDVTVAPTKPNTQTTVPTTEDEAVDDSLIQKLGSVLIVDDSGYEYYNFNRSVADRYVVMVSKNADSLKGTARVFDIVVPTSTDITLSDQVRKGINSSSQSSAIDYIYAAISPNCIKVKTFEALRFHRKEYVYFRTDHHWTALGAYYAYREYAAAAGIRPAELTEFTERKFDNFIGAFYNDSDKNKALEKNPDTVYAYEPKATNSMEFTNKDGKVIKWNIITDVSEWNRGSKYNAFIGGDNPYSHITNPGVTDGSSCVVIKESFGNAFVPFLLANYSEIHVIDYRYWNGNLTQFVKSKGIQDVVFLNNISATRNSSLVKKMEGIT